MFKTFLQTNDNINIAYFVSIANTFALITKILVSIAIIEVVLENNIIIYNLESEVVKVFRNLVLKYLNL